MVQTSHVVLSQNWTARFDVGGSTFYVPGFIVDGHWGPVQTPPGIRTKRRDGSPFTITDNPLKGAFPFNEIQNPLIEDEKVKLLTHLGNEIIFGMENPYTSYPGFMQSYMPAAQTKDGSAFILIIKLLNCCPYCDHSRKTIQMTSKEFWKAASAYLLWKGL